jgi:TatD DNase family protein
MLTDTHCHIHEAEYQDADAAYERALSAGVKRMICVGTDEETSRQAVEFSIKHADVWSSVGLHPHDAKKGLRAVDTFRRLIENDKDNHVRKIVAIGECGLDYFYNNSTREQQISILEAQLQLAQDYDLPVIFHVRDSKQNDDKGEVWKDFWPILRQFKSLRGVLHSFTDTLSNMEHAVSEGLYIGVNGIATFTKDKKQCEMFGSIPVERMLLETDSPYLTPVPHRGNVNEPAFVTYVAHHIANLRSINLEELSRATERNATTLFLNTKI